MHGHSLARARGIELTAAGREVRLVVGAAVLEVRVHRRLGARVLEVLEGEALGAQEIWVARAQGEPSSGR